MKKPLKIALLILAAIFLIIGVAYIYLGYAPKPIPPQLSANIQQATINIGNLERSYLLDIIGIKKK